eukprot:CAMPEP_0114257944 /NCGR_PEP_ID=MMETSP0058-20121206/19023_1 /TAXON_ID=36894 /ORGANISM="Pyramimonas parkeae, CCMP726" /LENGTH=351 /DNA_ID=CAMNT_0001372745 /DNA_START=150 /DNA_END=1205 /DNA_ORIENTATION=+
MEKDGLKGNPAQAVKPVNKMSMEVLRLELIRGISNSNNVDEMLYAIKMLVPVDVKLDDPALQTALYQAPEIEGGSGARTLANNSRDTDTNELLTRFRDAMKEHGARGIHGIGRKFRILDDDNSGTISFAEFLKGIGEMKLNFTRQELTNLFRYFDLNCDGHLDYEELLTGIRGELNARRKALVKSAFVVMDKDKDGVITIKDLVGRYDASEHPDVISGRRTEAAVFREFLDTFDCGAKDGVVHPEEFLRYYSNLSASIDDDGYFELMMRNAWHISDDSQTIEEIKNDFDIGKSDFDMTKQRQQALRIDVQSLFLIGNVCEPTPVPMSPNHIEEPIHRGLGRGAGPSSIVFG